MDTLQTIQEIRSQFYWITFGSFVLGFGVSLVSVMYIYIVEATKLRVKMQSLCPHKNKGTYVNSTTPCCETTTETCLDCGKVLSNVTDCR